MLASTQGGAKFSWFYVNVLIYWNPSNSGARKPWNGRSWEGRGVELAVADVKQGKLKREAMEGGGAHVGMDVAWDAYCGCNPAR